MELNEQKKQQIVNQELFYLQKKQEIKAKKQHDEFVRGYQYSKIVLDNERFVHKKQAEKMMKKEREEYLMAVNKKKREIKDFFKKVRKPDNIPQSPEDLVMLQMAVENEVTKDLVNQNILPNPRRSRKKKSRKTKKEKRRTKKQQHQDEEEGEYIDEELLQNPEIRGIIEEEQQIMEQFREQLELV